MTQHKLFVLIVTVGVAITGSTAAPVHAGEILDDGNMDNLTVGTNPDTGQPAGAWLFPQNYIDAGLGEVDPGDMSIVETASFDPNRSGNSLRLNSTRDVGFTHLPNIFTRQLDETPDQIIRVTFQIFVPGPSGGGSIYVSGDHGGGGFHSGSDRGPQLSWLSDRTLVYSPGNVVVVQDYPFEAWQTVRLDIDLTADNFDMYWAAGDDPLQLVGDDLPFRSGPLTHLDRFTFVHFSDLLFPAASYVDEITVEEVSATTCRYRLKKDAKVKGGCTACPLQGEVIASDEPCEIKKDCPKKLKTTIDCPDGPGSCKKIKGKRVGCE